MKPDQLKRAKEIERRLIILRNMLDSLQRHEPFVAVYDDAGGNIFDSNRPVHAVQHVLPKNIKALCLDAVDTEIAVLQQEMEAL